MSAPAPEDSPNHVSEPQNIEPKTPVTLDAPKDDVFSVEELAKCDGTYLSNSFTM